MLLELELELEFTVSKFVKFSITSMTDRQKETFKQMFYIEPNFAVQNFTSGLNLQRITKYTKEQTYQNKFITKYTNKKRVINKTLWLLLSTNLPKNKTTAVV